MGESTATPILAVDGGGSGCRLALRDGATRVDVTSGPANVSTDFGGAVASIRTGLEKLSVAAGVALQDIVGVPAYLGLAGIVGPNDAVQVAHALPLTRARIESDQAATVEGALGDRDGAVAGLGTGSFFGLRIGTDLKLAGGWGPRIDDRASGFWLGREALRAALMVEDGRTGTNWVNGAVVSRFGTAHTMVSFARDASPEEMASLAGIVLDGAERQDPTAQDILARGADHVLASLRSIGWSDDVPICPTGGVAHGYAQYLGTKAKVISPAGTPLDGAIARARAYSRTCQ